MTLDDRAMWTYQNMDMIYSSVEKDYMHPEAEKPVTFYACCLEWTNYLADKENHLSHLPIQIDGEIVAVVKPCEFRGYLTIKLKTILSEAFCRRNVQRLSERSTPKWVEAQGTLYE